MKRVALVVGLVAAVSSNVFSQAVTPCDTTAQGVPALYSALARGRGQMDNRIAVSGSLPIYSVRDHCVTAGFESCSRPLQGITRQLQVSPHGMTLRHMRVLEPFPGDTGPTSRVLIVEYVSASGERGRASINQESEFSGAELNPFDDLEDAVLRGREIPQISGAMDTAKRGALEPFRLSLMTRYGKCSMPK